MRMLFLPLSLFAATASAAPLVVDASNSPFNVSTDQSFDSVTVAGGGTVVFTTTATLTVTGDVNVQAGGTITHDPKTGIRVIADGNITIAAGGFVDVLAKGFGGGSNGSAFGGNGETVDPVTLLTIAGAGIGGGGSHGNVGGGGPAGFGVEVEPVTFGGGGGAGSCATGGRGGGRVFLQGDTIRVDGLLRADGEGGAGAGCCCSGGGGGGAGGSIWLEANTFAGGGSITAVGGTGNGNGGAGGRIYIHYGAKSYAGGLSVLGAGNGGTGTAYLLSTAGALSTSAGRLSIDAGDSFSGLTIGPGGTVDVNGAAVVTAPINVPAGATLNLNASDAIASLSVVSPVGGVLRIRQPLSWPTALSATGGTIFVDAALHVAGDLTLNVGGILTHDVGDPDADITATGTVNVKVGGFIDLNGKGYDGVELDPTTLQLTTTPVGIGGNHGGVGVRNGFAIYDDARNPSFFGSSGGNGSCVAPAPGGGLLNINADTLRVDGILRVDGGVGGGAGCCCSGGAAGGGGGGLRVQVTSFVGSGVVTANGGSGNAGGGGGGRIAIFYTTNTFGGVLTAQGVGGGSDGSVWLQDAGGHLIAQGGTLEIDAGDTFTSVLLRNGATLDVRGNPHVTQPIVVALGSTVRLLSPDNLQQLTFDPNILGTTIVNAPLSFPTTTVSGVLVDNQTLTVNGNLTIPVGGKVTHSIGNHSFDLEVSGTIDVQTGGLIDVTNAGLTGGPNAGFGDAGGTISPVTLQIVSGAGTNVGGTHGGRGGGNSPVLYDDPDAPDDLGGGGGDGSCAAGGNGGGRVHIHAATLTVNGQILAVGGGGAGAGCCCSGGAGGGAGGTIAIDATALGGVGNIVADGGAGAGLGGGGGRIRVNVVNNTFTGLLRAAGGAPGGGAGTINVVNAGARTLVVAGGTYTIGEGDSFSTITLGTGGLLVIDGAAHVDNAITIPLGATVQATADTAFDDLLIDPTINGTLRIDAPLTVGDDVVLNGTLIVNARLLVGNLDVKQNALVTHTFGVTAMNLVVSDTLNLEQGGHISGDALGMIGGPAAGFGDAGATIDPVTLLVVGGSGLNNGGSHATLGGKPGGQGVAAAFDSVTDPIYGGSGGGDGSCAQGGSGGGVIRFSASTFVHNGVVSSEGGGGPGAGCCCSGGSGGGAGGTMVISVGVWSGSTGVILGRGGNSATAGGGAGAVVVLNAAQKNFDPSVTLTGGSGSVVGAAGVLTENTVTDPPQIVSQPPVNADVGRLFRYRPITTGSPPFTFTLVQSAPGSTIDASTGEVLWLPPTTAPETFHIHVQNTVGVDDQTFIMQPQSAPFITSTPATTAIAGAQYHYDADDHADASGTTPITWSSTTTPAGFTIDPASGLITWLPAAPATEPVCILATNARGSNTQCFQVVVSPPAGAEPPVITSTASLVGFVGVPYAYDADATVEASGVAPIGWATLLAPAGFGIDPITGIVDWTPDTPGAFGACVLATNAAGEDTQCFTVNVQLAGPPIFTSTPLTLAHQGAPYIYDADGIVSVVGPPPITFSAPNAPVGFVVDSDTGVVTWIPQAPGNFDIVVRASNGFGDSDEPFTVSVLPTGAGSPPVIVHSANNRAAIGLPFVYDDDDIAAAGGDAPIAWTATTAPTGFRVAGDSGLVTWTPDTAGPQAITLHAENAFGADDYTFNVDVASTAGPQPTPVIAMDPVSGDAPLLVHADGSQSFAPPGDSIVFFRWSFGDGTAPATDSITTHVYERAGSFVARLHVADAVGAAGDATQIVSALDNGVHPPAARILVSNLSGSDNLQVSFSCDCSAGDAPIEAFLWDFGDGEQSDLAAVTHEFGPGGFEVRLSVVDANGLTATDSVQVRVAESGNQPPLVSASALPVFGPAPLDVEFLASAGDVDGSVASVSWDFGEGGTATGPSPRYSYASPGTYDATVTVTDDQGLASTAAVEIEVGDQNGVRPPQILSLPVLTGSIGVAYAYDEDGLPAARGDRPLTWSLGKKVGDTTVGAPPGMTVDATTGAIAWTPSAAQAGNVPVTLVASNAAAAVAQDFQIVVGGTAPAKKPATPSGCGCGARDADPSSAFAAVAALAVLRAVRRRRHT